METEADARLICNHKIGQALDSDTIDWIFKELKKRIQRNLKDGIINDRKEKEKVVYIL